MRRMILLLMLCLAAPYTFANDGPTPAELKREKDKNPPTPIPREYTGGEKRPTKIWKRTGPLGKTPKRVTDAYPLSDQQNKKDWVKFEPMSDEFEGEKLDLNKWVRGGEVWSGRPPGWFNNKNVTVSDGKLHLTMRKEKSAYMKKHGFGDYSCASLYSKGRSSYGYYEVLAKPMDSAGSSAFWFQREETPGWLTEIDVFEIGGNAKDLEYSYNMNLHVWKTPRTKQNWYLLGIWVAPWRLADDYHVYGFEWGKDELIFYVDGVPVYTVENTHWHQPLRMIFDSETMPDWLGLPEDKDLPSTFSIEYVQAWKKRENILNSGKIMICMLGAKGAAGMTEQQEKDYERIFGFMDRDGDDKVSKDQYVNNGRYMTPEARRGIFAATDRNKDNVMTKAEYVQNRAITDEAKRIVGAFDADKNGKVTINEFIKNSPLSDKALAEEIFKKLDIDKSKDLIVPEYLRVWGNWAREK